MEITDASVQLLLNALNQIGVAATHVYEVYVQAQYVLAIGNLVVWIITLITYAVSAWLFYPLIRDEIEPDDEKLAAICMTLLVALIVAMVVGFISYLIFQNVVMRLMCPEYMAIQDLFGNMIHAVAVARG
jgi:small-conductance mechanosensitive channel